MAECFCSRILHGQAKVKCACQSYLGNWSWIWMTYIYKKHPVVKYIFIINCFIDFTASKVSHILSWVTSKVSGYKINHFHKPVVNNLEKCTGKKCYSLSLPIEAKVQLMYNKNPIQST